MPEDEWRESCNDFNGYENLGFRSLQECLDNYDGDMKDFANVAAIVLGAYFCIVLYSHAKNHPDVRPDQILEEAAKAKKNDDDSPVKNFAF